MASTSITEPTPAPDAAPGVGSMSSGIPPVTPGRDVLRALVVALLVGGSVASPASALLLAPFAPVLVAIRLLRTRRDARRFVVMATVGSLLLALAAASEHGAWAFAVGASLLLVPLLAFVHDRAARHDPIETAITQEWPEPRIDTGLTPTIAAWLVATLAAGALALPAVDDPVEQAQLVVRDATSIYDDWCADDGIYADQDERCAELLGQRDDIVTAIDDHSAELAGGFAALFAFSAAATAHLVVLLRARRVSDRVRRSWRLRELELHWSFAYVLAAGLVAFMLAGEGSGTATVALRSVGVGLATLGGLAVLAQGVGLVAWVFARGRSPVWYRVVLTIFALFVLPVTFTVIFFLGVLDLAIHPRRRALRPRER